MAGTQARTLTEVSTPVGFSVIKYSDKYSGHIQIKRLLFIGERCPELRREAFDLALHSIQSNTYDSDLYEQTTKKGCEFFGENFHVFDKKKTVTWHLSAQSKIDELESQLLGEKKLSNRDGIRRTLIELGEIYCKKGDFKTAISKFQMTDTQCVTVQQQVQMHLDLCRICILEDAFDQVRLQAASARKYISFEEDTSIAPFFNSYLGLYHMMHTNYRAATQSFQKCHISMKDSPDEVLTCEDIGLYGGLCALTACNRKEIKSLLDHPRFGQFLALVPEVRGVLANYVGSRYSAMNEGLTRLKALLQLDMYFAPHISRIYDHVREELVLLQYFSPYVSVSMHKMAQDTGMSIAHLEHALQNIIFQKKLNARIDSHNKVLLAKHTDERVATFLRAFEVGSSFVREARGHLWKTILEREGFVIPRDKVEQDAFSEIMMRVNESQM